MDEQEEKYVWEPSEMDIKMSDAVDHTVRLKLKNGHEVSGFACYYEDATAADEDFPVLYIMNNGGDGAEGYSGDDIEELEIID